MDSRMEVKFVILLKKKKFNLKIVVLQFRIELALI